MRFSTKRMVLTGLAAVLLVGNAHSALRRSPDQQQVTVETQGSAAGVAAAEGSLPVFVPDQLIVKYRDTVEEPVHRLLARGGSFLSVTTDASDSLDRLDAKFGVRSARPVFGAVVAATVSSREAKQATVKRLFAEKLEAVRRRYPQRAARATSQDLPDLSHIYVLELEPGTDVAKAAREFGADPHVEYAQPNYVVTTQTVPNDPYYQSSGSWGQAYEDLWGLGKIEAGTAWDVTRGENIVVAVVDSGLDMTHPDIAANVWSNPGEIAGNDVDDDGNGYIDDVHGWNFAYDNNDPTDDNGHGTHVSGTIAAVGNNGLGIIGVAPQAKVMPLKGLSSNGSGGTSDLVAAIMYATQNGADVINNSWGSCENCPNPTAENAVRQAHAAGVVMVFAAGNDHLNVANYSPQHVPEAITVAASTDIDNLAWFSNFGAGLDVAAPGAGEDVAPPDYPGSAILSLKAAGCIYDPSGGTGLVCPDFKVVGGDYLRLRGTSMAAPHVAGVAALVLSAHLSDAVPFTVEQVRQALRRGSDDIGDAGFDEQFGYGRINATKALAEADPLEALITSPSGNFVFRPFLGPETIVDAVDVRGIAKGPDFVSYTVEYGAGATPTSWTTLATSTTPVSTAGPLASLDTVPDGVYTLRLTARNTNGQVYEDRQPVKIERLWLVNPLAGPKFTAFRGGSVKSIAGVVNPRNFLSYRVEVREFPSGILVPNADITLTDGGTHTILLDSSGNPGVLATWNTVGVPAGYYVIRVVATLTDGSEVLEEAQVIVDPTLHPGWPINLGRVQGVDGIPYRGHLNAADVNLDGKADLLVGYGETVRVHDHTGAWLPGWPESNGLFLDGDFDTGVTAGDLTGDGVPEVVAGNNDGLIFVWSSSGDQLPIPWGGYSNGVSESPYAWTAIADVDGNGTNEIVTTDGTGTVNLFGNSGQLPDWPQTLGFSGGSDASPPVVGDIDGDGRKEIAVIGLHPPNDLYVLSSNGEILPGWPRAMSPTVTVADTFLMQPVMGELDSDALKEIVVCAADGLVHVLNHDGSEVPGWPQATPIGQEGSCSPPVIADVDGDGRSEVVVGVLSFEDHYVDLLYAWHRNGTLLSGWPIRYDVTDLVRFGFSGAAVADLDGDGRADVTASRDGRYALGAYAPDGAELPGFPKPTIAVGAQDASTPAVADFDGDGLLELAWIDQDRNVYMWDLDGPSSGAQPWPVFNRDAQRTGANLPALDRLAYDSYTGLTEVDGNGNGWVDPGETWELYVNLRNNGASSVSGVSANLAVDWLPTAGMVYLGPDSSDYGTIAPGQVVPSLQAYRFRVAENFPCGGGISLSVTGLTSTDGSSPDAVGVIRIPVGTDSLYYDGFEPRSDGLYWSADVDWQSGVPGGLGAPQPDPASAYEGQRIMGTDLTGLGATPGNYENGVTSYLTSPGIRIPFGLQPTEIKFAHWINLAAGDYVTMHVYSDIPGDQKYFQWGSLLNASSWTLSSFDISDMAPGKSFLQVEFILQTDAQSTSSGFNMDAFEVRASGPVCEAITSSLPGEATNLRASKGPAGKLTLEWNGDCGAATNFAIYRGDLGIGYSSLAQEPGACDVTGTTATIPLGPGSAEFFLVVPHTDAGEGSYGVGVGGTQRTPATGACYVQGVVDVCAL